MRGTAALPRTSRSRLRGLRARTRAVHEALAGPAACRDHGRRTVRTRRAGQRRQVVHRQLAARPQFRDPGGQVKVRADGHAGRPGSSATRTAAHAAASARVRSGSPSPGGRRTAAGGALPQRAPGRTARPAVHRSGLPSRSISRQYAATRHSTARPGDRAPRRPALRERRQGVAEHLGPQRGRHVHQAAGSRAAPARHGTPQRPYSHDRTGSGPPARKSAPSVQRQGGGGVIDGRAAGTCGRPAGAGRRTGRPGATARR